MEKVVLIGGGGYCASVIDSMLDEGRYEIVGITDPTREGTWCGIPIIGDDTVLPSLYKNGVKLAHVTVGSIAKPTRRKELVKVAKDIGFQLVSVVDPSAKVARFVSFGEMVYVGKNAIINPMTKIGNYCMINTGCIIEHGCMIQDWVHVAPGCTLAADLCIGDSSHIGVGTTILQGLKIGNDTIIGAGSVVVRDVASNKTVYGVVKG